MTRLPLWALVPILMVLMACSGQEPIPAATLTSAAATAESSSITQSPTNIIPTPPPRSTPESTAATATPTPASSTEAATSIPTQEPTAVATPLCRRTGDYSGDYRRPNPNGISRSTIGPNGSTGPTMIETAETPGRRSSSRKAWLRSPLSPNGNAGSKRAGGTVHSLAPTSRRQET